MKFLDLDDYSDFGSLKPSGFPQIFPTVCLGNLSESMPLLSSFNMDKMQQRRSSLLFSSSFNQSISAPPSMIVLAHVLLQNWANYPSAASEPFVMTSLCCRCCGESKTLTLPGQSVRLRLCFNQTCKQMKSTFPLRVHLSFVRWLRCNDKLAQMAPDRVTGGAVGRAQCVVPRWAPVSHRTNVR